MPYLKKTDKAMLDAGHPPNSAGELNYLLTQALQGYIENKGGLSYQIINDVVGALECCKVEFYRRVAAPYEAGKRKTNGDVY